MDQINETIAEAAPLISSLDFFLLFVLAGASIYYFFLKDRHSVVESHKNSIVISNAQLNTKSDSGFISKMKSSGKNVVVFYGSQTGTAEEFAGRLAKEANRWGMKGMIADPEEFDMSVLPQLTEIANHLAIFCMATYGEGDPTDNAQEFTELLQNGDVDLSNLQYTVFALGNKTYEHYNATGKFVDKKIEELGGQRIFEIGFGDDDANMEDDFITWKDRMWPSVCEQFGIEAKAQDINMRQYKLTVHQDYNSEKLFTGEIGRLKSMTIGKQRPPFDMKNPFMAEVLVNRDLHKKSSERNCLHIEINIEGSRIRYDAGDHVAVYPANDPILVEKLCSMVDQDPDTVISLTNLDEDSSKRVPFPCPCTYRTALSHYIEIMSLPRTHVLKELAEYSSDPEEKEHLLLMSGTSDKGKQEYQRWIQQDCRNIISILEDHPSCKPPLDHLCEMLPRLQARFYSISSTPKVHPTTIHITAVVLTYETPTGRTNKGVCTNWLMGQMPTDNGKKYHLPVFVRKSQFRLPNRSSTPILMIGPGTGIAPFRGFLQERQYQQEDGKNVGKTVMYFGCRKKSEDFLYEEELRQYQESGLLELHVAFSRDQADKIYVTHLLEKNKADIWRLIGDGNANVYVCGEARKMAKDVSNIITSVCQTQGRMSELAAENYVKKMISQRRYSSDVWR